MSPTRRTLIASGAVLGSLALAGCQDRFAPTANGSGADSQGEESIETVGTDCGTPDDEHARADRDGNTVTLSGVLVTSNPCHEAVLVEYSLTDGELSVDIDAVSTLDEGEVCIECIGAISYEATIEVDSDAVVARVRLNHVPGETFTIPSP